MATPYDNRNPQMSPLFLSFGDISKAGIPTSKAYLQTFCA